MNVVIALHLNRNAFQLILSKFHQHKVELKEKNLRFATQDSIVPVQTYANLVNEP